MKRSLRLALGLIALVPALAWGQAIGPGFELERSGHYGDAATVYFTTVRADPTNLAALLGLERTLHILNRMPELLPLVQNARARLPERSAWARSSSSPGDSRSPHGLRSSRHWPRPTAMRRRRCGASPTSPDR